jgi:RNA polymerase sigma factor (sigma-70 family)
MASPDEICSHRDALIKLARRKFRLPLDMAEDLVHDTLLAALSARHRFHVGNLWGWLYVILKHQFIEHWRREKRISHETVETEVLSGAEDEMQLAQVILEMGHLPVKQLRALIAISIEELTYEAMAIVEGVPEGTIKSRVFRARQELARKCEAA